MLLLDGKAFSWHAAQAGQFKQYRKTGPGKMEILTEKQTTSKRLTARGSEHVSILTHKILLAMFVSFCHHTFLKA